jgi:diguanylate cyclase (GGDEF)-like protein
VLVLSLLLISLIGIIDYFTGAEISLSIFYLIPVALVAWHVNAWAGVICAALGGVTWYLASVWAGHPYSSAIIAYWNATVRFGFFTIVVIFISKIKTAYKKEQRLARTDTLTAVYNARHFYQLAEVEIARARRYKHSLSVAFIDIDNFKIVNDGFGRLAGDALLRNVADVIKNKLRTVDIIARLGGDEFIVLLPETGKDAAHTVMDKIQKLLQEEMQRSGWPVTFSIGAVTFNKPPMTVDELIKKADDLMYYVKASGKNQIIYDELDEIVESKSGGKDDA